MAAVQKEAMVETAISNFQFNGRFVVRSPQNRFLFDFLLAFLAEESPLVTARNHPQTTVFHCCIV